MARVIPPVPGHLLTLTLHWRNKYHRTYTSVMYYNLEGGNVPATDALKGWVDDMHNQIGGEVDDIQDHETECAFATARFENNEGVDLTEYSTGDPIPGALGDLTQDPGLQLESIPPTGALCLRKITGYAGRHNRGRLFIPFVSEMAQHDGLVDGVQTTAVKQICTAFMEPVLMAGFSAVKPAHWDRKNNRCTLITRMVVNTFISSRRDRRWKGVNIPIVPT